MKKYVLFLLSFSTLSSFANPNFTITNEVQPTKVVANDENTSVLTRDGNVIGIDHASNYQYRIYFSKDRQNINDNGCRLKYTSKSGAFSFYQDIEGEALCEHIYSSLRHVIITPGCEVIFSVNTERKEVIDVESTCDFRASLETYPKA